LLGGTPTTTGFYNFTIEATDAGGYSGSQPFSGVAIAAPTLTVSPTTCALPAGSVGSAYSQQFIASGGISPYRYGLSSGALPPGLSLNVAGFLSGSPTQGDNFIFAVEAIDSYGHAGVQFYGITVNPVPRNRLSPRLGSSDTACK
jgi:hypothetical protein